LSVKVRVLRRVLCLAQLWCTARGFPSPDPGATLTVERSASRKRQRHFTYLGVRALLRVSIHVHAVLVMSLERHVFMPAVGEKCTTHTHTHTHTHLEDLPGSAGELAPVGDPQMER
jgi:hypothetical protein